MITLTIAGTDRTERVELGSLKIENILTRKRDTCSFSLLSPSGNPVTPVVGQEVIINFDPGTGSSKVFGGVITELDQEATAYKLIRWKVFCQDYTRLLDRRLVPNSFQNKTVDEIIAQLKDSYFPAGFTTNNASAPVTVKSIKFNYKQLSKCIEDLADLIGYDWYVDYDKDLHFFKATDNPAPFNLADGDGSCIYDSLVIRRDNSQVRNRVTVRGGEYEASNFTADIEADGDQVAFPLAYRFETNSFSATLTGQLLNVGIDGFDDPDDFDALWNNPEKVIKFRDARKPTAGSVLTYGGKPLLPVIVRVSNSASISTFSAMEGGGGIYEHLIVDKYISSKEEARQRARADLEIYATTLSEGEFETHGNGLRAGQKILVSSASRGISEYFVINKVTFRQFDAGSFRYHVSLITTKSFDLTDLLIRLSLDKIREVVVNDTDVVETLIDISDTLSFSDVLATLSVVIGPYAWDHHLTRWNKATYS